MPATISLNTLSQLINTQARTAALKKMVTGKRNRHMVVDGLAGSASAMLFAALPQGERPYLIIANDLDEAGS